MWKSEFTYQTMKDTKTDKRLARRQKWRSEKRRRKTMSIGDNEPTSKYEPEDSGEDHSDRGDCSQSTPENGPAKSGCCSSKTLDRSKRDKIAVAHLMTVNENWGNLSPMMLAIKSGNKEFTAHELCWNVVLKVWKHGTVPVVNTVNDNIQTAV